MHQRLHVQNIAQIAGGFAMPCQLDEKLFVALARQAELHIIELRAKGLPTLPTRGLGIHDAMPFGREAVRRIGKARACRLGLLQQEIYWMRSYSQY